jgi:hypothetical protein
MATPIVAGSAAILIGYARERGTAISNGSYVSPRNSRTVYHAETSEVIKAALMAGADRATGNRPKGLGDVQRYRRLRRDWTSNGLDMRFGAGQLNVRNSFYILDAGECDSAQDSEAGGDGRGGSIGRFGFDYDPAFGGQDGSNDMASYSFRAPIEGAWLKACLAWNASVNESWTEWDGQATLYDLDLRLYDLTRSHLLPVAASESWTDSTENIHWQLEPGHHYELRVMLPRRQAPFLWDYGLAWQIGPVLAAQTSGR